MTLGIQEFEDRPILRLDGRQTFWQIVHDVHTALKLEGHDDKAREFVKAAFEECDEDVGILIMLAFMYVRYPGTEY